MIADMVRFDLELRIKQLNARLNDLRYERNVRRGLPPSMTRLFLNSSIELRRAEETLARHLENTIGVDDAQEG